MIFILLMLNTFQLKRKPEMWVVIKHYKEFNLRIKVETHWVRTRRCARITCTSHKWFTVYNVLYSTQENKQYSVKKDTLNSALSMQNVPALVLLRNVK